MIDYPALTPLPPFAMSIRRFFFLILSAVLVSSLSVGQTTEAYKALVFKGPNGRTMPYRLFVPHAIDSTASLPLVVISHGAAGRGDDNIQQITGGNAFVAGIWITREHQSSFACFVVAPQCPETSFWAHDRSGSPSPYLLLVINLIDRLESEFHIDKTRLYVIGQSMGGVGTFSLIGAYPKKFAAAVPICGAGNVLHAPRLAAVPFWIFHGERDPVEPVKRSREMVAAITKAGGRPKYTEYKGVGHNVWTHVVQEPDLLPWLFAQRRAP